MNTYIRDCEIPERKTSSLDHLSNQDDEIIAQKMKSALKIYHQNIRSINENLDEFLFD